MRSNDTEFAAIKLPRCLMGGGRKWSEVDTVWFDETVAPSTRERSTTSGDRGIMTLQTAAPPAEERAAAAPNIDTAGCSIVTTRPTPPSESHEHEIYLCKTTLFSRGPRQRICKI